jgi:hypothetical protein
MRTAAVWVDVSVLNISRRGMMVRCDRAPKRGTIVELRKGHVIVIGRVVWSIEHRFGVRTQDPIGLDALTADQARHQGEDRRRGARNAISAHASRRPARSREIASAAQYIAVVILVSLAAVGGAIEVYKLLSAPIVAVRHSLER